MTCAGPVPHAGATFPLKHSATDILSAVRPVPSLALSGISMLGELKLLGELQMFGDINPYYANHDHSTPSTRRLAPPGPGNCLLQSRNGAWASFVQSTGMELWQARM